MVRLSSPPRHPRPGVLLEIAVDLLAAIGLGCSAQDFGYLQTGPSKASDDRPDSSAGAEVGAHDLTASAGAASGGGGARNAGSSASRGGYANTGEGGMVAGLGSFDLGGATAEGGAAAGGGPSGGPTTSGAGGIGGASCSPACVNPHGLTSCANRLCVPTCVSGYGDCDGIPENGCEADLTSDPNNCGQCSRLCSAGGGAPACDAGGCGAAACDLNGMYALKIVMQASWAGSTYVDAGSGTFTFWVRLLAVQSGNNIASRLTECGRSAPDFAAASAGEIYSFGYPDSLFDSAALPTATTTVTLSNPAPPASWEMSSVALLMGTTMADPIGGAWPASAAGWYAVDTDGDGEPGVTGLYRSGGSYSYPHTAGSAFAARADRSYVASRVVFLLRGTLSSCTGSSGAAEVKAVDKRIFGCHLSLTGQDCSSAQADFLDGNEVHYAPGTATYTLTKVTNSATCADIRAAL